ncbi:MAG: hypothetical protein HY040_23835 [Planctomycetes bacterium]|nr:hypothetical protein [Planctomycetota bacterium]
MRTNLPLVVSASVISLAIGVGAGMLGTMWYGYRIYPDNDWGCQSMPPTLQVRGAMPAPSKIAPDQKKAKKPRAILASVEECSPEISDKYEVFLRQPAPPCQVHVSKNASAFRAVLTAS